MRALIARLPLMLRALVLVPLLAVGFDQARVSFVCGPDAQSCLERRGQRPLRPRRRAADPRGLHPRAIAALVGRLARAAEHPRCSGSSPPPACGPRWAARRCSPSCSAPARCSAAAGCRCWRFGAAAGALLALALRAVPAARELIQLARTTARRRDRRARRRGLAPPAPRRSFASPASRGIGLRRVGVVRQRASTASPNEHQGAPHAKSKRELREAAPRPPRGPRGRGAAESPVAACLNLLGARRPRRRPRRRRHRDLASGGAKATRPRPQSHAAATLVAGIQEQQRRARRPEGPDHRHRVRRPAVPDLRRGVQDRPARPDRRLRPHRQGQAEARTLHFLGPDSVKRRQASPPAPQQQGKLWASSRRSTPTRAPRTPAT